MSQKTLSPSTVTNRDSKGLKFMEVVGAAYNKAGLSQEEAQRVNGAGGLTGLIASYIAKQRLTDKYADEEVQSSYRYPGECKRARPIEDQIKALAATFNLDPGPALAYAKKLPELPQSAEGYFAVISPSGISKLFSDIKDPAEAYCHMLQLVHEKIASSRSFYNYREGEIDTAHLKVHPRTAERMKAIAEQQPGDILDLACQLGMKHRGRSVRRAREVMDSDEFGLTSVSVGCIVLTHPELLVRWEQLHIDCAGDEFSVGGDRVFESAPCFHFSDGQVGFGTGWCGGTYAVYGSASAFLPQ